MRRTESVKLACLSCDRRHAVTRPSVVCSLMTDVCGVPKHIPIMRTRHSGERMVTGSRAIATPTPVLSDAVLVERIAALEIGRASCRERV